MFRSWNPELPSGTIVLWYGTAATVPPGWQICDGTGGTPNLQNQYIKGNDADGNLGTTGGNLTHDHIIITGTDIQAGTDYAAETNAQNHEPPWTKIYFIMKL